MTAIKDIIEMSETRELAADRLSQAMLRHELNKTQASIADTFVFAITWCSGTLSSDQIQRYQALHRQFDLLVSEVKVGNI